MHRRLAVGAIALALIASATALSSEALPLQAASSCTGWTSQFTPPSTIRVLRTSGPVKGRVQTVNLRAYVENVMAWEWPATYPAESLKAGAIAVKQYGWYYTINYRGKTASNGSCYDVIDTATDQIYDPEDRSASSTHKAAVAATWPLTIRRSRNGVPGQFILTGYLPGSVVSCGAQTDGFKLYQKGVYDCGKKGKTLEEILRVYYGSTLEMTDPGDHQIVGSMPGDGGAVVPDGAGVNAFVHASTGAAFAPANPDSLAIADADTLGRVSADVTGDGIDELLILVRDGTTDQHVAVLKASGGAYNDPVTWWNSATAGVAFPNVRGGKPGVQLLAGDFDADGVDDAALLVVQDDTSQGIVYLLRSAKTAFAPLKSIYSGTAYGRNARPYGGDVTGDGRADVVLETDNGANGLRYWVLPSRASGILGARTKWYENATLRRATTLTVQTDWNRDGRDDLVLAVPNGTGFTFRGLKATGTAFTATTLYSTLGLAFERIKLGAGDVSGDGRGDVIMYARLYNGSPGTRLLSYVSNGTGLTSRLWLEDLTLDWQAVEPY